ncbi:hypothetical protein CAPTEDRAFT_225126 [Capitella teleta]|uniref:VWFA domain-containing protein n=1 Tax=Capitella teleta TaxID=283909 RepID=R7TT39_CAPTE|nr:hypothetical protein CAPTEDRAFT_225126 [Capitella teleta]|eukprot:ELT96782.1 hypothetical protein CAPTEDRAFT_225126 [Capitella teleta]
MCFYGHDFRFDAQIVLHLSVEKLKLWLLRNAVQFPETYATYLYENKQSSKVTLNQCLLLPKFRAEGIFDSLSYTAVKEDVFDALHELAEKLQVKAGQYINLVHTIKLTTETLFHQHLQQPLTLSRDCCSLPLSELKWNELYGRSVSQRLTCDLLPHNASPFAFNPGRNLTEVFQHNVVYKSGTKWQYFISTGGIHNEFPAQNFDHIPYAHCRELQDSRHSIGHYDRAVYIKTVNPQPKHVVIVMEHGISLSQNQLTIAKAVSKQILLSLNEDDHVSVFALSSSVTHARDDGCVNHKLCSISPESRVYLNKFIDDVAKDKCEIAVSLSDVSDKSLCTASTNHSLGFQEAFRLISNTLAEANKTAENESILIAYVSRGLLSSLVEGKAVLETISTQNARLNYSVGVNTFILIDDGKPIIYEKGFLQDVAEQNFEKYSVKPSHPSVIKKGKMVAVSTPSDLSSKMGNIFEIFQQPTPNFPQISLPFLDQETQSGVLMSMTWPCFESGRLLGVVGLDIHLGDLVEDVTYFNQKQNLEAFLIDHHGYVVMHKSLPRPYLMRVQPMHTEVSHFEQVPGFESVLRRILKEPSGNASLVMPRSEQHSAVFKLSPTINVMYAWKHLDILKMEHSPFILVVKSIQDGSTPREIRSVHVSGQPQLVYHRLDLLPTDNTCMHLKQLATMDASSLFLSAGAFQLPFEHLSQTLGPETKLMVQGYLAYLNDNLNLIRNPGMKPEIKKDVLATSRINSEWTQQYVHSQLNDYIIRRYVATSNGVMRMFPGALLSKTLDPTKREWYQRAHEYPGKVTFTAPYLDQGGAGYIVTISHAIYEGKHSAPHGPHDPITAVMGMDVTLKFFYKLLIEQLSACQQEHIRCFVMDDRGYLIAHRGLIEPTGRAPMEQKHITHKEPLAANDILNHEGFVTKKLCNGYTDRTIQRFYQFNTSLDGIVTNLVHGEHCAKYQIAPIPGTNLFMGVVNETCHMMRAFCPCSMIDRLCLNCHRMEQSECECPCECPLQMDFCTGQLLDEENRNPSCVHFPEEEEQPVPVRQEVRENLAQCYQSNCEHRKTKMDCMGVLDCEWCELHTDGVTPLDKTYCASQRICFAGVLGAATPYNDQVHFSSDPEGAEAMKSTPVGPVAGGIMGCFLVLALGIYCYRNHVHRSAQPHYMAGLPPDATSGRRTSLDNELEELESLDEPGPAGGHTNIILASFENPANISPYRMNTSYRRPTNAESDLGYSTMTPQDGDSEQASTTCAEPLIISRDRYRPPLSVSSRGSGILPPPPANKRDPHVMMENVPGQTILVATDTASPNRVIANVQVHMVDSH